MLFDIRNVSVIGVWTAIDRSIEHPTAGILDCSQVLIIFIIRKCDNSARSLEHQARWCYRTWLCYEDGSMVQYFLALVRARRLCANSKL